MSPDTLGPVSQVSFGIFSSDELLTDAFPDYAVSDECKCKLYYKYVMVNASFFERQTNSYFTIFGLTYKISPYECCKMLQ